ncbi:MAG: phage portal protein, partial [Anaerolineaceae bacterium]
MGKLAKLYDRALSSVGLRRVKASGIIPGTDSFQILKEWIESPLKASGSLDWDLRNKLNTIRQKARALELNNPLVRQYLQLLEQNVIGPRGIRLQSQVRNNDGKLNKAINNKIEFGFADFWRDPWVDGRMSGIAGEHLLIRTVAVDGEAFVRRVRSSKYKYGLKLQMIDPDLVDHQLNRPRGAQGENEIRLGIEVDEWGKAEGIWIRTSQQDINNNTARKHTRIPADDIIHLYDPQRINQTRGITWLNSVMTPLNILDGYVEATLLAARTGACSMPLFKHTNADLYETDSSGNPKPTAPFNIELSPGSGLTMPAGLEMQEFKPNQVTIGFGEFTKESKRWTSSGLCTSYNALANDLEGVNYSSMRSGLLIERDSWKCLQQMWIDRFRVPVFGWFLTDALLSGGLVLDSRNPLKFMAAKWVP